MLPKPQHLQRTPDHVPTGHMHLLAPQRNHTEETQFKSCRCPNAPPRPPVCVAKKCPKVHKPPCQCNLGPPPPLINGVPLKPHQALLKEVLKELQEERKTDVIKEDNATGLGKH